jgi:hypothetical protein
MSFCNPYPSIDGLNVSTYSLNIPAKLSADIVGFIRRMHMRFQKITLRINRNLPFTPFDFFASPVAPFFRRFDGLTVDDGRTRLGLAT